MPNKLDQLKTMTTVVADTGEINSIQQYKPEDATTNPSLLYKVAQNDEYVDYIVEAIDWGKLQVGSDAERLQNTLLKFSVAIGRQILQIVPGRVSTEVDARYSYDTAATIAQARRIIELYAEEGIPADRILIKIASTWEGIKAAEQLEQEGINCNLTLLFGFTQAVACAEAGVTLISPFVGRILDWHKKNTGRDHYPAAEDPGVISVARIYEYYKQHGYDTIIMGASFRNTGEIEQLAGCDRLTISPQLMDELQEDNRELRQQLRAVRDHGASRPSPVSETTFRWTLNEDAMATEKLAEGIRSFAADQIKLEELIMDMDGYNDSQNQAVL